MKQYEEHTPFKLKKVPTSLAACRHLLLTQFLTTVLITKALQRYE